MRIKWSIAEIEYLQENVGSDEVSEVIRQFRKQWPDRVPDAILTKIKRLGLSRIPIDGGWNCTGLAEMLGIDRDRVHDWIERGLLTTKRRKGKRHHRILERDFVNFAKAHPGWLRDIDSDRLLLLLPGAIVDVILDLPDRTRGVHFKVRSTRTGNVYPSMRQAEKHEFLSRAAIAAATKAGRTTRDGCGFHLIQRGK